MNRCLAICAVLAMVFLCPVNAAQKPRIYYIGNSLTDEVLYGSFAEMCEAAGHPIEWGRKMIPGAPIWWHKEHPEQGFSTKFGYPDEAFKEYDWGVLTMQPFGGGGEKEIEAALHYCRLIWERSPDCRIYIYGQWPSHKSPDWRALWFGDGGLSKQMFLEVYRGVKERCGKPDQVFFIPCGEIMYRLHRTINAGEMPGLDSTWDLYADGVHLNNLGSYMVGCSYYACIMRETPVGLPVLGDYQARLGHPTDHVTVTDELARIIQETVWAEVTSNPRTGVPAAGPVKVTVPALPDAVVGEPYETDLDAGFARTPFRWEVVDGALPDGVTLAEGGRLKGTPAAEGDFAFSARVAAADGSTDRAEQELTVGEDVAPTIVTETLPEFRQGAFVTMQLEASGGNGAARWAIKDGALPQGVGLERSGRLWGTPAFPGDYSVTLVATDADGEDPESDTRTYSGTVAEGSDEGVIKVPYVTEPPVVDGKLDPAEPWELEKKAEKPAVGESDNTVRFDLLRHGTSLYVAIEVKDANVFEGRKWGPVKGNDSVELYFDLLNNRERTYNADDRRLPFTVLGTPDRSLMIGHRLLGMKGQVTEEGYTMEGQLRFGWLGMPTLLDVNSAANREKYGRDALRIAAYDGVVFGFDLMVNDVDAEGGETARLVWQGSATNPEDPGQFGTAILMPAPEEVLQ